ncbi:iron chaperone [Taibaiella chishuiensis]|uniref:Uncharacterized protein YdhG (YjbR/CyaY superfamily) n=1 Tax=Taibaiella chishuiensis TaxID=1434707 RepID=A0A2P8DDS9_9BACT|nr:DUF1801 domain-containing protein [Taibaiella chishuiensis]PSK95327.1 uncharacterized protein YdhG (YjbR/CyaY superfamily) [Taibaiella chishuiensis]
MTTEKPASVSAYIASFPKEAQQAMQHIRALIRAAVPAVTESISYAMPAFRLDGRPLVYFAAYKQHIGFYPAPVGHADFAADLAGYKTGKGSVQFPLKRPMPDALILKILQHRLQLVTATPNKKNT